VPLLRRERGDLMEENPVKKKESGVKTDPHTWRFGDNFYFFNTPNKKA
jgi:hypothetical protein